jgi:hypothetical protein
MRTIQRLTTVLAVLAAAALLPATPAAAGDEGPWRYESFYNGLCIDVAYGSTANRARVQQWTCYHGAPEQWRAIFVRYDGPTRFYHLKNVRSGKCLDLPWGDPAYPLEQATCWDGDMQLWATESSWAGGDGIRLRNLMAHYHCVSVDTGYGAGASLWARPCYLTQAQRWRELV